MENLENNNIEKYRKMLKEALTAGRIDKDTYLKLYHEGQSIIEGW